MFCPSCGGEVDGKSERCTHCNALLPLEFLLGREADPVAGLLLEGRYRVEAFLSRGGMGYVYRGTDLQFTRPVAIKFLDDRFRSDHEVVSRFHREAQAAAGLDHPNIIPMYSVGESDGHHYFVMKYVEGMTVSHVTSARGRLPLAEAVRIAGQVCEGLDHIHSRGYVHRDIKPTNVMIDGRGHAFILDFGILRLTSSNLTQTGLVAGTPEYMSPEQARDAKSTDARSDIYSLGVMVFEMIAGARPFKAENAIDLLMKHLNDPPPSLEGSGIEHAAEVNAVVQRALAKDPASRYASALDFKQALVELVTPGAPMRAPLPVTLPKGSMPPLGSTPTGSRAPDSQWAVVETPRSDVRATAIHGEASAIYPPLRPRRRRRVMIATLSLLLIGVGAAAIFYAMKVEAPSAGPETAPPQNPPVAAIAAPPPAPVPEPTPEASALRAPALPVAVEPKPVAVPAPTPPTPPPPKPAPTPPPKPVSVAIAPPPKPAPPGPGTLWVESDPEGAEVTVDGKSVGKTPLPGVSIAVGTRKVVVKKRGYFPHKTEIEVASLARSDVKATLKGRPSRLRVIAKDAKGLTWAEVLVDGKPFGSNPVNEKDVASGKHIVSVRRAGFISPPERIVKIAPGSKQVLEFVLQRE